MATFEAKIEYIDVRVITVEADTIEEARLKYDAGEWDSEDTVNFYSNRELQALRPSPESASS